MSKISALSVLFKWNKVKTAPSKTSPRSRCKHACCLHNEFAYLIGGKDGSVSLKDFYRFNIATNKWEELSYRGEKIPHFEGHSFVSHKRLLLLFGGVFGYDHTESALWIINPDLKYIRRHVPDIGSPQPCARRNHSAVIYNNVMYVYGGYVDLQGSTTSDIWAFHIDDEEWELISPNQRPENTAGSRHGHSSVVYGREMWVYGGMSDLQSKADFWRFNFHSLKWDRIKTKFGPPCLSGHTASVVRDYMVMVGGETNGELSSDIWIFGFCTLKWTHYQNSHQYPSPRKWHAIIPVTTHYRKGDNSVRTKSLPHLQKKGQNSLVKRPKSSPGYSSARFARRSPEKADNTVAVRPSTLAININDANQNSPSSQQIEMKGLNGSNSDRSRPYKSNGFSEKKEKNGDKKELDKSPLLYNRQSSRDSVISNNSGLGTDNPCLELDSSYEKLNDFTNCVDNSSDMLVSYELQNFVGEKDHTKTGYNSQVVTRFVKNKNQPFNTSHIPGQVLSPGKRKNYCIKNSIDQNLHNDLVLEDLEFCDNHFSNNSQMGSTDKKTIKLNFKISSNKDLNLKHSSDAEFSETEFQGRSNIKNENSLEEKSYSLNDITETNLIKYDSLSNKSVSMHVLRSMSNKKCSLNCWMEEAEKIGEDNALSPVDIDGEMKTNSQVINNTDKDGERETKTATVQEEDKETVVEVGPPYLLLIGGYGEKKTHNISAEPIEVWQCDILVRHSDISHGEYYKSSLVI